MKPRSPLPVLHAGLGGTSLAARLRVGGWLLFLALLPVVASAQTTVTSSYSAGQNVTVKDSTIGTSGTVNVPATAIIRFRATSAVTLSPGFSATAGGYFRAFVFIDSDGDGMDDSWEIANGFNPNDPADAATDADGDGISNLAEYLLGTNPRVAKDASSSTQPQLNVHRPIP